MIKHWSRTQNKVSLSSGEAELYALIKAASETIGLKHLLQEMGVFLEAQLATDSSAAKGTVHRTGTGRLKHLEINAFRLREVVSKGAIKVHKVPRSGNYGDLMTHRWDKQAGERMFAEMCLQSDSHVR